MIRDEKSGVAWLGLGIYVAVYDYFAIKHGKETLSAAFGRSMEHQYARPVTVLVVATLIKHLMFPKFLPKTDPLSFTANKWRQGVELVTPDV